MTKCLLRHSGVGPIENAMPWCKSFMQFKAFHFSKVNENKLFSSSSAIQPNKLDRLSLPDNHGQPSLIFASKASWLSK